ncbi:MAG: serine hydrolase domain-containing protein [Planctomycetia bacterium]
MSNRRRWLARAGVAAAVGFGRRATAAVPVTGRAAAACEPLDALFRRVVAEQQIPGAVLAVARNGRLLYARGFGFADADRRIPVAPTALFRLASVSKPITALAVLRQVAGGAGLLDGPGLDLKKHPPGGVKPGAAVDARLDRVTVRHLLHHAAGWDRDQSGDPIGRPLQIARDLNVPPPPTPEQVLRWTCGRPLDFDPGARYAYSNVGYLALARWLEDRTGRPYADLVQDEVWKPIDVTRARLGRAKPEDRPADEVRYYDAKKRVVPSVVGPDFSKKVPLPDGGENFEGYEAHGGWIASAVDVARFLTTLPAAVLPSLVERPPGLAGHDAAGKPKETYYGAGFSVRPMGDGRYNLWHTGLIAGTSTLAVRRHDGFCWAALFNTDAVTPIPGAKEGKPGDLVDPLLHRAVDAVDAVADWPTRDLFDEYLG